MSPAELAANAFAALPLLTAWPLVRSRPYYRPIARLLTGNLVADLLALAVRELYLAGQPRPYGGLARALFHGEQLAGLVWPVGVAAVALVVLARRSPRWAFLAGAVALAGHVAAYPWLRGDRLAWALLGEQVALVGVCCWAGIVGWQHARSVERMPMPVWLEHHKAALVIAGMEAAMLTGALNPLSLDPYARWWMAQISYSVLFAGLAIMQGIWTWRARRQWT